MLDYGSLSWNNKGQAVWRHVREAPCPGPYWAKKCQGYGRDEYGSMQNCPECGGNGRISIVRYIRCPQYDVTHRPRKGWKPRKTVIDKAFKA